MDELTFEKGRASRTGRSASVMALVVLGLMINMRNGVGGSLDAMVICIMSPLSTNCDLLGDYLKIEVPKELNGDFMWTVKRGMSS